MEFREVVRRRRMIRRFADRPVERAVLDRVLDAARRGPSAGFAQGTGLLVLDEAADVARFWEATTDQTARAEPDRWLRGMTTAPVLVVPLADPAAYADRYAEPDKARSRAEATPEERWRVPWWWVDTGMATLLVLQSAVDEGLAGCLFGIPPGRVEAVRTAFDVPADLHPLGVVALGHRPPADEDQGAPGSGSRRARRPLDDVVRRGRWSSPAPEAHLVGTPTTSHRVGGRD